ncbi:MAG: hypothetical protein GY903_05510 [Fuerstiella sp.]|nr:hypothetical protein [Fuerstiella sp.]MCP4853931.1 hypothetical protein [Fuerstiella sp.]
MRSLIRPALFMVARIGLVLSVVMWGVGQRMGVEASAKFANTRATYVFGDVGVVADVALFDTAPSRFHVTEYAVKEGYSPMKFFDSEILDEIESRPTFSVFRSVPGITIITLPAFSTTCVLFHHWLTVTFFAVFYGVLKWVYRKRGKVVADE